MDTILNLRGTHMFSRPIFIHACGLSASASPPFLPSTSHFPPGNVKVQDAETRARDTA